MRGWTLAAEMGESKPIQGYFEVRAEGLSDQLDEGSEGEEQIRMKTLLLVWAASGQWYHPLG